MLFKNIYFSKFWLSGVDTCAPVLHLACQWHLFQLICLGVVQSGNPSQCFHNLMGLHLVVSEALCNFQHVEVRRYVTVAFANMNAHNHEIRSLYPWSQSAWPPRSPHLAPVSPVVWAQNGIVYQTHVTWCCQTVSACGLLYCLMVMYLLCVFSSNFAYDHSLIRSLT
jgi:hypothetical protein